jgi:hypothetical protein
MKGIRAVLLLIGFGLGIACAHEPGTYASPYRQAIYDMAKANGSCERSCCEATGGEHGVLGVWSETKQTCAWHADPAQAQACQDWCLRETGLSH